MKSKEKNNNPEFVPTDSSSAPRRHQTILPRDNLPDDPKDALREISKYINTIVTTKDRDVPAGLGKHEVPLGYWQTADWFDGLLWLAIEAERVGNQV